jgi:hypothetical protein
MKTYLQKELRNVKEKRKSRVKVGSVFECVDRRQNYSIQYTDYERRSGIDRRSLYWDLRKT